MDSHVRQTNVTCFIFQQCMRMCVCVHEYVILDKHSPCSPAVHTHSHTRGAGGSMRAHRSLTRSTRSHGPRRRLVRTGRRVGSCEPNVDDIYDDATDVDDQDGVQRRRSYSLKTMPTTRLLRTCAHTHSKRVRAFTHVCICARVGRPSIRARHPSRRHGGRRPTWPPGRPVVK